MPRPPRGLAATACAIPAERIDDREDLIAAAGSGVRPANTRKWQASPRTLPPSRFAMR